MKQFERTEQTMAPGRRLVQSRVLGLLLRSLLGALILFLLRRRIAHAERFEDAPNNETEFLTVLADFQARHEFDLYCIVLAQATDAAVISTVKQYRVQLARMAGDRCCIVYLRNPADRRAFEAFDYSNEQEQWTLEIARLFNVELRETPCLLFFERLADKQSVVVSLKGLDESQIVDEFKRIFSHLEGSPDMLADLHLYNGQKRVMSAVSSAGQLSVRALPKMAGYLGKALLGT
jgi:hypothetical protein